MLAEDSPESRRLFDELLEVSKSVVADGSTSGTLRPSSDPDAQAVALVVLWLAPFTFTFTVTANLVHSAGSDAESAMTRFAVPIAEIYTTGLMTDGAVLESAQNASGARA